MLLVALTLHLTPHGCPGHTTRRAELAAGGRSLEGQPGASGVSAYAPLRELAQSAQAVLATGGCAESE